MQYIEPQGNVYGLPATKSLLTQEEAALQLNLKNPHTLAVWRSTKRYPELVYVRVGRYIRYTQAAIDAFIQARTIGTNTTDRSA